MDLRSTNADEKLPVKPYGPQPSRDRKGANVSPDFRLFFKGAVHYTGNFNRLFNCVSQRNENSCHLSRFRDL
jgi:hypothetical protein